MIHRHLSSVLAVATIAVASAASLLPVAGDDTKAKDGLNKSTEHALAR